MGNRLNVFKPSSVTITGGTLDGVTIGGTTPAAGTFTEITFSATGGITLPSINEPATPTLSFGDGDSGFFEQSDDRIDFVANGGARFFFNVAQFASVAPNPAANLLFETASATNPVFAFTGDGDTGLGSAGADQLSLIAGGVEAVRYNEASSHSILDYELHAGITASTTQTQAGGTVLLSSFNEVSTVANENDTVVMPTARVGRCVQIINVGANKLQIFPAVGDNLGSGVDQAQILEANQAITYIARNATNWHTNMTTQIIHGEMSDNDNTDAFVINAASNFHCYHSNGIAVGDILGWTFDAGGAGTSHAITAVADGAASGVDIKVTTGTAHGLAVGDIISQTNLTDAAYEGVFKVKAIISSTEYEVAAVFTATDTGTMDQSAVLEADTGSTGTYKVAWSASATSATSNDTFDFQIHKDAVLIPESKARRKFGASGDFGHMSGTFITSVTEGQKFCFAISNTSGAGNLTIRNFNLVFHKL